MNHRFTGRVGGVALSSCLQLVAATAGLLLGLALPAFHPTLETFVPRAVDTTTAVPLVPGGPAAVVTYALAGRDGAGAFAASFESRAVTSEAGCRAPDPARAFDLELATGADYVYSGTLSGFAAAYPGPDRALALPAGSTELRMAVYLDPGAGNELMGCASRLGLGFVTTVAGDGPPGATAPRPAPVPAEPATRRTRSPRRR
jgi:hypothetical protein